MEEKNIERFNFLTKIYANEESGHPITRIIGKVLLILMILILLFQIGMEGFSGGIFKPYVMFSIFIGMIFTYTKPRSGYKNVPVILEFNSNNIVITYNSIDKYDNMEIREEISIKYTDIDKLQYGNSICCLNIEGTPFEVVKYSHKTDNKELINGYSKKREFKQTLLYVNEEYKDKILTNLRMRTGLKIAESNYQTK
jgi:hypothetical protein